MESEYCSPSGSIERPDSISLNDQSVLFFDALNENIFDYLVSRTFSVLAIQIDVTEECPVWSSAHEMHFVPIISARKGRHRQEAAAARPLNLLFGQAADCLLRLADCLL